MSLYATYMSKNKRFPHNNKLPAYLELASSWLVSSKAESYYYPFCSQIQLLMIISAISISFLDILFSSNSIQMVFFLCIRQLLLFLNGFLLSLSFLFLQTFPQQIKPISTMSIVLFLYRTNNTFTIGVARSFLFSCCRQNKKYRSSDYLVETSNENLLCRKISDEKIYT